MNIKKKLIVSSIVATFICGYPTNTAQAGGFFLTNIIEGIFNPNATKKVEIVKYGSRNKQVVTVQEFLIKSNYLKGKADGIFGQQTMASVKEFQKDNKLIPDGIVGEKTFKALKSFKGKKPIQKYKPKPTKPQQPSHDGIPSYSYAVNVVSTAYTRYDEGCTDYTYLGTYARRGVIAVDPDVIPLRSEVYIPGYGYAVAEDIGGAIQGNRVDLFMETLDEAFNYGVREVTVYVIN